MVLRSRFHNQASPTITSKARAVLHLSTKHLERKFHEKVLFGDSLLKYAYLISWVS